MSCLWSGRLNFVKMSIRSKINTCINTVSNKQNFSRHFLAEIDYVYSTIYIWKHKWLEYPKQTWGRTKLEVFVYVISRLTMKYSNQDKKYWQKDRHIHQWNRDHNWPDRYSQLIFFIIYIFKMKIVYNLRSATWWSNTYIVGEISTRGNLINMSPPLHIVIILCVWWVSLKCILSAYF